MVYLTSLVIKVTKGNLPYSTWKVMMETRFHNATYDVCSQQRDLFFFHFHVTPNAVYQVREFV